jgi:hypothetical protein
MTLSILAYWRNDAQLKLLRRQQRLFNRRHDTDHNDTQHNDNQHNDTQHNDTQHNDTQHNDTQHKG